MNKKPTNSKVPTIVDLVNMKHFAAEFTFGYDRAESLGALLSIILIWVLTVFLVHEGEISAIRGGLANGTNQAFDRIHNPREVNAGTMLIVSAIGIVVNVM